MTHKPFHFKNLTLTLPHKTCFEDFNGQIFSGDRIAIVGQNGSGKSSLLNILRGVKLPSSGEVKLPSDANIGYVPQVIEEFESLSGAERFNKALSRALNDSNILMLDEPTNHLDPHNRKSIMRLLNSFPGTLIIVSHDLELLRNCVDIIWHIDNGEIHIFSGNYDDYMREIQIKRTQIEQELSGLNYQKKDMHQALMKEQMRAAKSKSKGEKSIEQRKWPTIVSKTKALKASATSGKKKASINNKKQELSNKLSELRLPEIIIPKFSFNVEESSSRIILSISEGSIGYCNHEPLINNINFSMSAKDRIAIKGRNGSGKSTFIKSILNDLKISKSGNWYLPKPSDIGYLDQHYDTLISDITVFETIKDIAPTLTHSDIRRHLNDFLFRKNEEVNALVSTLSGGEKVRLILATIALKNLKLLILDEITNNLDLETKEHVSQVIRNYPAAIIVISHDEDFLHTINIDENYIIKNGKLEK